MPVISVILPVYNAEKYLREAIDSILHQTFTDFELLVINDGSTDDSERIILSYTDDRIIYITNEKNSGLIYSLNKGIELARGQWIARMDGDDISMPQRFEKQLDYLTQHNDSLLATTVKLIDKNGNPLPDWQDDINHITASQIKNFLPKNNCIAHPTVMAKASIFKRYQYQPGLKETYHYQHNQKYSEDYDLWLRLAADGVQIEKLPEPLLLYRELSTSVTRYKKINIFYRIANVKFRFLWAQLRHGNFSRFHFATFLFAVLDIGKGLGKQIKVMLKK